MRGDKKKRFSYHLSPITYHCSYHFTREKTKPMTEAEQKEIRAVVQDEILGIISDAQQLLGMGKDPTGIGKKALEGLANVIRRRQQVSPAEDSQR